jgi:hypothetical protein
MSYDNNMTGLISKNERKTDEKHPDIKGQCEINGVQYWVDGWAKTRNSDGGKFYSLRFKAKDAARAAPPAPSAIQRPSAQRLAAAQQAPSGFDDMSDDVPW